MVEKADAMDSHTVTATEKPAPEVKNETVSSEVVVPENSTKHVHDAPPSFDPVSMMPMEGHAEGQDWEAADEALKDIEQVTAGVQEFVVDIASSASKEAAAAVQELGNKMTGLTGLSSTFSTWWSTFDPMGEKAFQEEEKSRLVNVVSGNEEKASEQAPRVQNMKGVNLQALFGLPAEETLMEAFPCKLVQTFRCTHNSFMSELPMSFPGTLYITDKHVCIHASNNDQRIPIVLEHAKLRAVSRQKARRGEKGDTLKLHMSGDQWVALHEFAESDDIESALALMEHLSTSH